MKELVDFEHEADNAISQPVSPKSDSRCRSWTELLRQAKELGLFAMFSWRNAVGQESVDSRYLRTQAAIGIQPVYKLVDTCAAEFEAATPYYYSTYETPYQRLTTGNGN